MSGALTKLVAVMALCTPGCLTLSSGTRCTDGAHYRHRECNKFLLCSNGMLWEQRCPPGLLFNDELSVCDYAHNVTCTGDVEASTGAVPSETSPDGCPPEYDPGRQVYLPHQDCSRYYICDPEGHPIEQRCPAGLLWNATVDYCDFPERVTCHGGVRLVAQ